MAGVRGNQGATGLTGAGGSAGPQGLQGVPGAVGPAGASGGGASLNYQGAYGSTVNYAVNDVVVFGGSSYASLVAGNRGSTPGVSAGQWGLLAAGGTGPVGPQGVAGPVGPAGATGSAGVAGPAGPTGVVGSAGAKGAPGLLYQGAYASGTNYALGDVVLWQGGSWASLLDGNRGNTPNFSPGQWGVLTVQGPVGATGAKGETGAAGPQGLPGSVGPNGERGPQGEQGIPGQAGAQGLTGAAGPQGLQGPAGAQGVVGPVGMVFRGAYSSAVNYGAGDGVAYGGSGYVSLVAGNVGQTPDLSPAQWAVFATGTPGAQGPIGLTGPQGVAGQAGPLGVAGVAGAAGAMGPQGPAVANYTGNYGSAVNYALNDAVSYQGSTYISLVAGNRGNAPGLSAGQWAVLAAQGAAGAVGPAGVQGAAGASGASGVAGAAGAQGPAVTFLGGWLVGTSYALGDAVSYGGSSYVALTGNVGRQPDLSPLYWGVLALAGAAGPAGVTGATGLQGPTGFAGAQGVAGPVGPAGGAGAVGATGPAGAAGPAGPMGATGAAGPVGLVYRGAYASGVNYGIGDAVSYGGSSYISLLASNAGSTPGLSPAAWGLLAAQGSAGAQGVAGPAGVAGTQGSTGVAGAAGATGAAGPAGLTYRGGWSGVTSYGVGEAVLLGGTTYLALAASTGLAPDQYPGAWAVLAQGSVGPTGPAGSVATVSVGTVITGPAGSSASVTNSGSAQAAMLNFTLPQGAVGASGAGGGGGASSSTPLSMYHAVSFAANYYSVSTTNASAGEGASVLTWVPAACTATKLTVYSQQSNTVTVTLRSGVPGAMADTVLACSAVTGVACTVTGSVAVAAGSFVDVSIAGASGTAAGVWTALACE